DADPDPMEVPGAQMGTDRLQAVVPVVAATELEPDCAQVDVELVVDGDDMVRDHLMEVGQFADRDPGLVHVGTGSGQHELGGTRGDDTDPGGPDPGLDDLGPHPSRRGEALTGPSG